MGACHPKTSSVRLARAGIAFVVCLIPTYLLSQQPESIADQVVEPILTEESLPEEQGECDLRTSIDYRAASLEPPNALPRLQLFCGFLPRWGAEISVPFAYPDKQVENLGFGDISTTLKYQVSASKGRIPALVLGAETRFPTGTPSRGTGEEGFEVEPFVALLAQGSRLGLQGNIGFGFPASSRTRTFQTYYYNTAATLRLTSRRLYFIGEANGAHTSEGDSAFSLSPGLHYGITERLYIAVAFPVQVVSDGRRVGMVIQMQFRLPGGRVPK